MRRKGWLRHIIPSCRDAIQAEKQQELPHAFAAAPQLIDKICEKSAQKSMVLIDFGTGILMRRRALTEGRGSTALCSLRGS